MVIMVSEGSIGKSMKDILVGIIGSFGIGDTKVFGSS